MLQQKKLLQRSGGKRFGRWDVNEKKSKYV